jgi:hypothetical protein
VKDDKLYTRSLGLLDQFILEKSENELASIISKYANPAIKGPTFDEYYEILQNELEKINWSSCTGVAVPILHSEISKYSIMESWGNYPLPPPKRENKTNKKDSVPVTESFFLL